MSWAMERNSEGRERSRELGLGQSAVAAISG
jgi:hypothetical protein